MAPVGSTHPGAMAPRESAWRYMLAGGLCSLAGALITAYLIKRQMRGDWFIIGGTALLLGAVLFFRGFWKFVRG